MGHVFISYSRRDAEVVRFLEGKLHEARVTTWLDREQIKAGNTWRSQIVEAIDTCEAFLLCLSPRSSSSDNVRREVDLALDAGKTIFVFRLEMFDIPREFRYQLTGLQYIDVPTLGMDEAVRELLDSLETFSVRSGASASPATRQAELVIKGVNLATFTAAKQEELLKFIADLINANPSELTITNLAAGSVHVFVDMPASAAFDLKTKALNRDKRFRQARVVALRLVGDKKFINTSLGILTTTATTGLFTTLKAKLLLALLILFTGTTVTWALASNLIKPSKAIEPIATFAIPNTGPLSTKRPATETHPPTLTATKSKTPTPACILDSSVSAPVVLIYEGPSQGYYLASTDKYEAGYSLTILAKDRTGTWLMVRMADGQEGWLYVDQVRLTCPINLIPEATYIPPLPKIIVPHQPRPPKH